MQRSITLIDLVKSFPYFNDYLVFTKFTCKIGFDIAENEPSKVCQELDSQID